MGLSSSKNAPAGWLEWRQDNTRNRTINKHATVVVFGSNGCGTSSFLRVATKGAAAFKSVSLSEHPMCFIGSERICFAMHTGKPRVSSHRKFLTFLQSQIKCDHVPQLPSALLEMICTLVTCDPLACGNKGCDCGLVSLTFVNHPLGPTSHVAIGRAWLRRADAVVIGYDITSSESLHAVNDILGFVMTEMFNPRIMLVGHKADLESNRQVSYQQGLELAAEISSGIQSDVSCMEVSAKTYQNVEDTILALAKLALRDFEKPAPTQGEIELHASKT